MNAVEPTATDPNAGQGPAAGAPDQTPDQGAGEAQVMITAKADGTFEVQPMVAGQPAGDPVPAQSIDDAMSAAQDALGASGPAEPAADQTEGNPAEEGAETPGQEAAEPPSDAATYAQKKGTRPKIKPSLSDYMNAPPQGK
jgi:hypothetical protein